MTTRTGAAPAARQQLSPVDGLAQLSFLIQGLLERRAAEHQKGVTNLRSTTALRVPAQVMPLSALDAAARAASAAAASGCPVTGLRSVLRSRMISN